MLNDVSATAITVIYIKITSLYLKMPGLFANGICKVVKPVTIWGPNHYNCKAKVPSDHSSITLTTCVFDGPCGVSVQICVPVLPGVGLSVLSN